jgi:hypothetical protein
MTDVHAKSLGLLKVLITEGSCSAVGTSFSGCTESSSSAPEYWISSWVPSEGRLKVLNVRSGKKYEYVGISPFLYNKIKFFQKKKAYGKGWQILRKFRSEVEK